MSPQSSLLVLDAALAFTLKQFEHYTQTSGQRLARRWITSVAETFNKILDLPSLNAVTVIHQYSGLEMRQRTIKGFRKFLVLHYIEPARASLWSSTSCMALRTSSEL